MKKKLIIYSCLIALVLGVSMTSYHMVKAKEYTKVTDLVTSFKLKEANWLKVDVAINEVVKQKESLYTEESWNKLLEEVNRAKKAKQEGRTIFEQDEVNEYALNITEALNNLEVK